MEVKANLKYIRVSPQKCRLIVDTIRGKKVSDALDILNYSKQKSSGIVKKVLESAIANAEHNNGADIDTLTVKTVFVNDIFLNKLFNSHQQIQQQFDDFVLTTDGIKVKYQKFL